jgi:hypothetical protein
MGTVLGAVLVLPAGALASSAIKIVHYRGYRLAVPAGWPVFHLAAQPTACVRFNRHALYLGPPGAQEHCPAHVAGRTEAILIQPAGSSLYGVRGALPSASNRAADGARATEARIVDRAHGLLITATWGNHPGVIGRALGIRSLSAADHPRASGLKARLSATSSTAGQRYAGQAFDACSAPSSAQMSAWSSAYRAIGVYIGGANMGCSQANLTSRWVSQQSSAGWHLIPIYVGLQAPSNYCGCAAISPSSAGAEGRAAAQDAVTQAQALGLGAGNPIYYDMEGYATGAVNSSAVLTFLAAWTQQLHAAGYLSGVYSSDDSGVSDLVARYGTGYAEPDEIWSANWNGQASTTDPNIPGADWADHQRLHQYAGNENRTHEGVTINIDSDYVDGATAAAGSAPAGQPRTTGSERYWLYTSSGNVFTGSGTVWYGSPAVSAPGAFIAGMAPTPDRRGYWLVAASGRVFPYGDAQALPMVPALSLSHPIIGIVASPAGGYWLYTAYGNVYSSSGADWYGSPAASQAGNSLITGMAATPDGRGYWLVDSAGQVFHYGDARSLRVQPAPSAVRPVTGIVASPTGGYWLYNATGNVYTSSGAKWYGSPYASGTGDRSIAGLAPTSDGHGYWLVDSAGRVFAYGDAAPITVAPALARSHPPVTGIVG